MEDKETVTGQFLVNLGDLLESMTARILREPDPQTVSRWLQEMFPHGVHIRSRSAVAIAGSSSCRESSELADRLGQLIP